jgi:hypothetical protein
MGSFSTHPLAIKPYILRVPPCPKCLRGKFFYNTLRNLNYICLTTPPFHFRGVVNIKNPMPCLMMMMKFSIIQSFSLIYV